MSLALYLVNHYKPKGLCLKYFDTAPWDFCIIRLSGNQGAVP